MAATSLAAGGSYEMNDAGSDGNLWSNSFSPKGRPNYPYFYLGKSLSSYSETPSFPKDSKSYQYHYDFPAPHHKQSKYSSPSYPESHSKYPKKPSGYSYYFVTLPSTYKEPQPSYHQPSIPSPPLEDESYQNIQPLPSIPQDLPAVLPPPIVPTTPLTMTAYMPFTLVAFSPDIIVTPATPVTPSASIPELLEDQVADAELLEDAETIDGEAPVDDTDIPLEEVDLFGEHRIENNPVSVTATTDLPAVNQSELEKTPSVATAEEPLATLVSTSLSGQAVSLNDIEVIHL